MTFKTLLFAGSALAGLPSLVLAQETATAETPAAAAVASAEAAPPTGDEIVVCTTVDDPYRIPKALRGAGPIPPARQSWVNRVAADEQTSREAAGLPDTCSPVG